MEDKEQVPQLCSGNIACVCYTNLSFLVLLFIVTGFANRATCYQMEAIILQYNLIICSALFNCTVLFDPSRNWGHIPGMLSDRAEFFSADAKKKMSFYLSEIQSYFRKHLCSKETAFALFPLEYSTQMTKVENSSISLKDSIEKFEDSKETSKQNFSTPEIYSSQQNFSTQKNLNSSQISFSKEIQETDFSQPSRKWWYFVTEKEQQFLTPERNPAQRALKGVTKEQFLSDAARISNLLTKKEKLCVKDKYIQVKSPELFKNRIYLTRKILTNATDM